MEVEVLCNHPQRNCCAELFNDFKSDDIRVANLGEDGEKKGVYLIKIKSGDRDRLREVHSKIYQVVKGMEFESAEKFIKSRIERVETMERCHCPIIYIGAMKKDSKTTLKKRYNQLFKRHTIALSIWTLLYSEWELEFCWKTYTDPMKAEKTLMENFNDLHKHLPALNKR